MSLTTDDWLSVVAPYLPESLISADGQERLRSLCRHLPGCILCAIEIRLGGDPAGADLSLQFDSPYQAEQVPGWLTPPHVRAFLERWSTPDSDLAHLRAVWLEFDLELPFAEIPLPGLWANLAAATSCDGLLAAVVPGLYARPPSPALLASVDRCCRELPAGARLLYVARMLSRPSEALRMEFVDLDFDQILAYLERVAAPGTGERVARQVGPFVAGAGRFHLSFDVEAEVLPRIGVEFAFPHQPAADQRWGETLAQMVAAGLCRREKVADLLAWPGYDHPVSAGGRWPVQEEPVAGLCVRCLSHLKLVSLPDREPEAKAYLLFGPYARTLEEGVGVLMASAAG